LPIDFIENKGQWDKDTLFVARGPSVSARFERDAMVLRSQDLASTEVRLAFEDALPTATISGEAARPGRYNFYAGADPAAWRSDVPAWSSVFYRQLYEGIDLRVREQAGRLEYDLLLAPGIDAERVVVRAHGTSFIDIDADGTLLLSTASGILRQTPPATWEVLPDGARRTADSRFRKIDDERYGFEVTRHDPTLPLVIDPGLVWSTFLGGSSQDPVGGVRTARDGSGDVFVALWSNSQDFVSPGGSIPGYNNSAGVVRLSGDGTTMRYATFIGGWHSQLLYRGLVTNTAGEVVLGGETYSPDFPTTAGAFDRTRAGESSDGFVAKLSPTGALVFSTFLGGTNPDNVAAVDFAPDGSIIAGGTTSAVDFPTTAGAFDRTYNAPNAPADGGAHGDFFIARLSADGSQLTYGTYVGGPSIDSLEDLVVDPQGFVTAVGWVTGNNVQVFVSTPGAFDSTWNGTQDAALARLKLDGAGTADLKYASLIGGASDDNLWGVAYDPTDPQTVVVAGESWSDNYPTTAGVFKPNNPVFSALFPSLAGIITKFNFPATGGGSRVWSSYFGAEGFERAGEGITDVAINNAGEILVTGRTERSLFPTTRGAYDRTHAGSIDGFLSRLSSNGATLLYSTFFGGLDDDTDSFWMTPLLDYISGNTVVVAGVTGSTDLETTPGVLDRIHGNPEAVGAGDGYVLKLALDADQSGDLTVDAPLPMRPINGGSFSGSGFVSLEWTSVSDASGIEAYEYQVSPKPDFPDGFIHYKGSSKTNAVRLPQVGLVTWYWRVRTADRAGNLSAWSPISTFTLGTSGGAVSVNAVLVSPPTVVGGGSATGVVWLNGIAPSGGLVLTLSKHQPVGFTFGGSRSVPLPVTIPATVTVPAGATQVEFPVTTSPVTSQVMTDVMASTGGVGQLAKISVIPPQQVTIRPLDFTPYQVVGGSPASAVVTIEAPAPTGGLTLNLISGHPSYASVPSSVTIPAGATSASFPITTVAVPTDVEATIRVAAGSTEQRGVLHIKPQLPTLTSLTMNSPVAGGSEATGTLTFSAPLPNIRWPAGGHGVRIRLSDPTVGGVISGGEWIAPGVATHTFRIFTRGLPTTRTLTVTAALDRTTLSAPLTVNAAPPITISNVSFQPATVNGGEGGIGRINLAAGPATTVQVTLTADTPGAVNLPSTMTIFPGETSSMFAFTTANRSTTANVRVTASFGSSSGSGTLTVNPSVSVARIPLASLTVNPSSVAGGGTSTGTATLQAAARPGGVIVQLASYNSQVATVPASITVPESATSATFPITTSATTATTEVIISGLADNTGWSQTAGLVVTPGGPPPPPPTPTAPTLLSPANTATGVAQPVTLDWSDVANAASYEVQVDNSSTIASPFVANPTVTTSQVTLGTLTAGQRVWWRVRGRNSAGTAGAWSSTRSFTPVATAGPPTLSSIALSPSTVVGGNGSTGTVTLSAAAPSGGAQVTLWSSNTSAATVPASVTVAAGAASATFAAATSVVTTNTPVTITGSHGGTSRTATLTLTPQGTSTNATLTVTATGRSGERITSSPAGINVTVGSTGSASFATGTAIALSVSNGRDAIWSGACSSGGNKRRSCTFTLNGNASVTANVR
jgi:hypothetical protein